jgi:basic membrane lipoprotein Med (substrate-binding protein (PBP1-ABC) superfamily)
MRLRPSSKTLAFGGAALAALLIACSSNNSSSTANKPSNAAGTAGAGQLKPVKDLVVGAIHVGSENDNGYNEAMHLGLVAMTKNLPNVKLIEAENVSDNDVTRVMEDMINKGAKLIFPMNFDYLDPALAEAAKHPDVVFEHPAGFKLSPNLGTFWSDNTPQEYIMGQVAAKASKSGKLGWVIGFPIPNILTAINAFEIGAKSVNPNATTQVIVDNNWVDPGKEAQAVTSLHDQGVDVVAMLVDSPATVVQTADKLGMMSIGFHCLCLQSAAGKGWLTGIGFDWGDLFTQFAKQRMDGSWKSANVVGQFGTPQDYAKIAPFGASVDASAQQLVAQTKADLISGKLQVFKGPITDNSGKVQIAEGQSGDINTLLGKTDWLVQGASGNIK